MNKDSSKIAIRSFQSEGAHLLALIPAYLSIKNIWIKAILICISLYHVHRYIKYFSIAKTISINQSKLWYINLLDYAIIYLYNYHYSDSASLMIPITLSIISGLISFFFIYIEHGHKKKFSNNIIVDLSIVFILLTLMYFTSNTKLLLFCIRDLIYHLLEFLVFY